MAKKIKRKVSQVGSPVARVADTAVAEAPEVSVSSTTPAASYTPRSFNRKATSVTEFNPDYSYVIKDLKRIGVLAGTFFALLIVLSFVLPLIVK